MPNRWRVVSSRGIDVNSNVFFFQMIALEAFLPLLMREDCEKEIGGKLLHETNVMCLDDVDYLSRVLSNR
jgi:hypothetical protein